ncbi:MAG: DNA polymerase III subunit delta [Verrucomicrobiales bacterium]|jgi:DNA polymerase-3 subunit delta|nr:DNA polymerase III subunit delta [Verrucomicrobiales bacterium]
MVEKERKPKQRHILIAGSDEFAVKARAAEQVRQLMPDDPMNCEVIDAQAEVIERACRQLDAVIEAMLTLPFMGGVKLVHFRHCNFLVDSPAGKSEAVTSRLARLIEVLNRVSPAEAQIIISAVGVDKRKSFYKQFEKLGAVELHDLPDLRGARGEAEWCREIDRVMQQAGLRAAPGVAELLMDMVGGNRRALYGEVEKLALYAQPHGNVSEADLRLMVSDTRERIIWDLLDAVVDGRSAAAVRLLRQLLTQDDGPVGILIMLAGQVRLAAVGTHLLESGRLRVNRSGGYVNLDLSPAADEFLPVSKKGEKPNAFRLAKVVAQARRRPARSWFAALEVLCRTHLQLVTAASDPEKALETAIVRICQL